MNAPATIGASVDSSLQKPELSETVINGAADLRRHREVRRALTTSG
jgi:hypothetical protein